jgi:hypothetical protein
VNPHHGHEDQEHDDDPRPPALRDPDLKWTNVDDYPDANTEPRKPPPPKGTHPGTFKVREIGEEHAIYFHNPSESSRGEWRDGSEEER